MSAGEPQAPPNAIKVASEDTRFGGFYVPSFEVRIKGKKLPRDVVRDVMQVTYRDSVNQIDSFELTINNWNADVRDFKYVGIEKKFKPEAPRMRYANLFDPGDPKEELEIWMGYGENLNLMMSGFITTLEPNFPQAGAPTLAVRGLNVLWQLKGKQYTDFWPSDGRTPVRDSDIARDIGEKNDPETRKKRFPLKIQIDENARDREPLEHQVFQNNQHDIVFLLGRARRHGYVVVVRKDPKNGEHLYFGPSETKRADARDVTYLLEWGKSLLNFKPTLTTTRQVGSVTVHGWDRRRKRAFNVKVERKQIDINGDLSDLDPAFNQREEIVTDPPVYNEDEAKGRARAIMTDRQKEFVKGSGATIGLPDLRAGCKIFITDLGARFSGTYFVTDTTHTINDSGYQTAFNARREQEGEGK